MSQVDQSLVAASRDGDRQAFGELVTQYQSFIASIAYSATGDFARSEDITQQAFVTAWQKRESLSDPAKWVSWLAGIARNLIRQDWRVRQREAARITAGSPESIDSETPVERAITREQQELLWNVLSEIPDTYREPLVLYYREGKSVADVATLLELSADTVKQRLSRGRQMVRAEVARFVEDTLTDTRPNGRLSAAILAALPGSGPSAAVVAAVASKVGGKVVAGASAVGVGPLIGAAGSAFGVVNSLRASTSNEERRFIWIMVALTMLLVVGQLGIIAAVLAWFPELMRSVWYHAISWTTYIVLLFSLIYWGNAKLRRIKYEHGTDEEKESLKTWGVPAVMPADTFPRNSAIAAIASCAFLPVMCIRTGDTFGLLASIPIMGLLGAFSYWRATKAETPRDQWWLSVKLIWLVMPLLALFTFVRWPAWLRALVPNPNITFPAWPLALFLLVLGVLISAGMLLQMRQMKPTDDAQTN